MNITYKLLESFDILANREELIKMMNKTLEDNIPQCFPKDLGEKYVNSMPTYIEDGSAIIIGAFDEDKMIGFLWGYEVDIFGEKRIHNAENHVAEEYRGCGIAKRMLEYLEEEARKRNIHIFEAMCTASNESAYRYHVKNGYEVERIKFKKLLKDKDN